MASPPYRSPAGSPPYPSSAALPNPKKRPSLSLTSHQPAAKRRKPTNASQISTPATSHPLRQTSFPPEESAIDLGERSPSVESDLTAHQSVVASATSKPLPKKRGRKRKSDMASVVSGERPTAKDTASVAGPLADEAEEEDEADAEDGAQVDQDKEQKRMDKANMAYAAFTSSEFAGGSFAAMRLSTDTLFISAESSYPTSTMTKPNVTRLCAATSFVKRLSERLSIRPSLNPFRLRLSPA